jgi:hypothetical protein
MHYGRREYIVCELSNYIRSPGLDIVYWKPIQHGSHGKRDTTPEPLVLRIGTVMTHNVARRFLVKLVLLIEYPGVCFDEQKTGALCGLLRAFVMPTRWKMMSNSQIDQQAPKREV